MSNPTDPPPARPDPAKSSSPSGTQPPASPRGRPKAAWTAVSIGVVLALALVIFLAQNTQKVQLRFLWLDATTPLAVGLVAAAALGGAIVLLVGTIRVTQLRLAERRLRKGAPSD